MSPFVIKSATVAILLALLALSPVKEDENGWGRDVTRVSEGTLELDTLGPSNQPTLSTDGNRIAFLSQADTLVPDDTARRCGQNSIHVSSHRCPEAYIRDLSEDSFYLVSPGLNGSQPNGPVGNAKISGNGRFVVFDSWADNLVPGDENGGRDIFIHEVATKKTYPISKVDETQEEQTNSLASSCSYLCGNPNVNFDGRFVAWDSWADNIASGIDTNQKPDVFVSDRTDGTTRRVSVASNGSEANDGSFIRSWQAQSDDGRFVVFQSLASNLVDNDHNRCSTAPFPEGRSCLDVFVHDLRTARTWLVSEAIDGDSGDETSCCGAISGDGRFVAFISTATNLVLGSSPVAGGVFRRDLVTNTTIRIDSNLEGRSQGGPISGLSISSEGRYVAFGSAPVADGSTSASGAAMVYVFDTLLQQTTLVHQEESFSGRSTVLNVALSGDAKRLAFDSKAPLTRHDTNQASDVYLSEWFPGRKEASTYREGFGTFFAPFIVGLGVLMIRYAMRKKAQ